MGETITLFLSVMPRACNGKNIGGVDLPWAVSSMPANEAMNFS